MRTFLIAVAVLWIGMGAVSCAHVKVGHEIALDSNAVPAETDVEKAISQGDHGALARYYRALADAERKRAVMHEKMAKSYGVSVHYKKIRKNLAIPCQKLRYDALDRAIEYDRLAEEEEKLLDK